jgi:hypothetical protein
MNLLKAWAVRFMKGNPPEYARFFSQRNLHFFFQFYGNVMISSYSTDQFLDKIECILGFLKYHFFECRGLDTLIN